VARQARLIRLQRERIARLLRLRMQVSPAWQFYRDVFLLIWEYKWYSLAIFVVTIFQEFAALWPVSLLGQFIDRLDSGHLGNTVVLFMAASAFYPGLVRANVMLRHKMFYEADFQKRVELIFRIADRGDRISPEAAGTAYTKAINAVSGITNATYHVLGSFTPVIIKIIIVAGSLLGYNRFLGMIYLASLIVPAIMTVVFNKRLQVLRDAEYSVLGEGSGAGIRTISEPGNLIAREKFVSISRTRKSVLQSLLYRSQFFLYLREAALVGSQFLVVFIALGLRQEISMTAGDFTKIIGYTGQVAGAFISAASCLDNIISYSRAYHVYAIDCDPPDRNELSSNEKEDEA